MSLRQKIDINIKRLEKPFDSFNEITLSSSALLSNFDTLTSLIPGGSVFPVLKSNAYGHGIKEVATILKDRSFPYICVDGFYESLVIHAISKQPVLVMGAIKPQNFKRLNFKNVAFAVHDQAVVKALGQTKRRVKVHLELDTGMSRHGIGLDELDGFLSLINKYSNIEVEGVMTHLADADNPDSNNFTNHQIDLFDQNCAAILRAGFKPKYFHIAQSAGSAKTVSRYANAIRPGIAIYGINPLMPGDAAFNRLESLKPVLSLNTEVSKVIAAKAGTTVSYGRTFKAKNDMFVGILPLGYYEGVDRGLSNKGTVQYKDAYLPVVGRVCMNHTMIDLDNSVAKVGEKVIIISREKGSKVSISNICRDHNLFNYELLIGLNQNIRRRIIA